MSLRSLLGQVKLIQNGGLVAEDDIQHIPIMENHNTKGCLAHSQKSNQARIKISTRTTGIRAVIHTFSWAQSLVESI